MGTFSTDIDLLRGLMQISPVSNLPAPGWSQKQTIIATVTDSDTGQVVNQGTMPNNAYIPANVEIDGVLTLTTPLDIAQGGTGTTTGVSASAVALSALGQQQLATQRSAALTPWFAALSNRQFARADVACLGDSITEGQHATGPPQTGFLNRWVETLATGLRSRYPTPGLTGGGRGFIGVKSTGETSFTWPVTINGSPTPASGTTLGPKGQFVNLANGTQNAVFTLNADFCDLMYCQVFGGGVLGYQVDAGGTTTQSTSGTTTDGKLIRISLGSAGAHTLTVTWSSGSTVSIDGVIEYNGDAGLGIQVHDCGHFGWTTANWVSSLNGGVIASPAAAIAALGPNCIVITLGVNDQFANVPPATYQANLQSIITSLRARLVSPFPSVVLQMLPPRSGQSGYTFPWSQYVSAAYAVAAADTSGPGGISLVTVMDWTLGPRMPGADTDIYSFWQAGDLVHPSNQGHQMIADVMTQFLSDT